MCDAERSGSVLHRLHELCDRDRFQTFEQRFFGAGVQFVEVASDDRHDRRSATEGTGVPRQQRAILRCQ